jgi:hypothetical protein
MQKMQHNRANGKSLQRYTNPNIGGAPNQPGLPNIQQQNVKSWITKEQATLH